MVSGSILNNQKDNRTSIFMVMQENLTKKGTGSGIQNKFLPDPEEKHQISDPDTYLQH
jgi:hypothetical protein